MTQARRERPAPPRRVQLGLFPGCDGPILPGELRPLAPTPAASDSGDGPVFTEAQLLAMLVKHYRWVWLGENHLRRYNPHGRKIRSEAEALEDHGLV